MIPDLSGLVVALSTGKYARIAIQIADSDLPQASEIAGILQTALPESNVSVLGDSVTDCCLDEISAEHYGSDCIVKLGHSCWFASQRMPAYFLGNYAVSSFDMSRALRKVRQENDSSPIVIFVDSSDQLEYLISQADFRSDQRLFVCVSPAVSYPGSNKLMIDRFRAFPFSSIAIRSVAVWTERNSPEIPRVAGRLVFRLVGERYKEMLNHREVRLLVDDPTSVFLVPREGTLYSRLINRFGTRSGRVLTCFSALSDESKSNYPELLRRYRGVESVKNSSVIGIVVMHSAASSELFRVRDILSRFLRSAGKEVHMFSVSKLDGVKLGNFPEIECFVIMNCPESDYFESDDLEASCVSPFEALVAMESLDWSDHIITDYDEMLSRMVMDLPPRTPRTPRSRPSRINRDPPLSVNGGRKLEPAKIEMGLRGIPSRYVSEPLAKPEESEG